MDKAIRKAIVYSSALIFFQCLLAAVGLSQSKAIEEKSPEIRLGGITFQIRQFESTPSPLKILEIHVEVSNKSPQAIAPANSIKLIMVPKEIKYPEGVSAAGFNPSQEETTLAAPLPPNTGRILIFGLSLPEKIPESMTFEIQVDPPEGEKKTATWESGKN